MRELCVSATFNAADFEHATAVLQGLCGMSAWQSTHRVLYFGGPTPAKGFPKTKSLPLNPHGSGPVTKLWVELNQNLARSSFLVQLRYEVFKDRDFGKAESGSEDPGSVYGVVPAYIAGLVYVNNSGK